MRILLLTCEALGRGANAIRAFNLGRSFAAQGHAVTLVTGAPGARLFASRQVIDSVRVAAPGDWMPARLRRAGLSPLDTLGRLRLLARERFDIVHAFGHRPAVWIPVAALRRRGEAKVVSDWADWFGWGGIAEARSPLGRETIGRFDHALEQRAWRLSDGVTVVTEFLESQARQRGFPPERILRLTAGADVAGIRPLDQAEMRRRHGIPLDKPVVVHAGLSAFDREAVGEVFAQLAEMDGEARLLVLGEASRSVRRWAEEARFRGRVLLVGHVLQDRLGEVLACGNILVLPLPARGFNRARFPNRLAEAFAAGRPVVTHAASDAGRLVEETQAGLVCGEDPAEMAEACLRLCRDHRLAEELGRNARCVAEERLAWPVLAVQVLALYGRLVGT